MVGHIEKFDDKELKSVGKGCRSGNRGRGKEAEEARKDKAESHASLIKLIESTLEEHVKEVRFSTRLTSSAVCLAGGDNDMSPGLERMLRQSGQAMPAQNESWNSTLTMH